MATVAVRVPVAVGANATPTEQVPFAAMLDPQVLDVRVKSLAWAPVMVMPVMAIGIAPGLPMVLD